MNDKTLLGQQRWTVFVEFATAEATIGYRVPHSNAIVSLATVDCIEIDPDTGEPEPTCGRLEAAIRMASAPDLIDGMQRASIAMTELLDGLDDHRRRDVWESSPTRVQNLHSILQREENYDLWRALSEVRDTIARTLDDAANSDHWHEM